MAVGTFLPEIEIWNLDSEDCDPVAVLGSVEMSEKLNKRKSVIQNYKSKGERSDFVDQTHTDAIMCLSLNKFQNEYLLSGSADKTVRIWDLEELSSKATYASLHTDKVQAVKWNEVNESIFLSGAYDGKINIVDVRSDKSQQVYKLEKSAKDIESALWHPKLEHNFVVSTESGKVFGYDTRRPKEPLFSLDAHKKACSSVSFSPHFNNMMATVSVDQIIKVWDINVADGAEPKLISKKKPD